MQNESEAEFFWAHCCNKYGPIECTRVYFSLKLVATCLMTVYIIAIQKELADIIYTDPRNGKPNHGYKAVCVAAISLELINACLFRPALRATSVATSKNFFYLSIFLILEISLEVCGWRLALYPDKIYDNHIGVLTAYQTDAVMYLGWYGWFLVVPQLALGTYLTLRLLFWLSCQR